MTNSGGESRWRAQDTVVAMVNGIMAALAGVGGVVSALGVLASGDQDGRAAAGYFAVRAAVIAVGVVILAIRATTTRRPGSLPVVLLGAGVVQFADVPISFLAGNPGVAIAAFVLGAVHLTSAWLLRRR